VVIQVLRRSGRADVTLAGVVVGYRPLRGAVLAGPRKVDRRPPWRAALRVRRPAGARGRVYARVVFTRAGSKKLRRKTVSRRFLMCR
jgi:hypothetical protein